MQASRPGRSPGRLPCVRASWVAPVRWSVRVEEHAHAVVCRAEKNPLVWRLVAAVEHGPVEPCPEDEEGEVFRGAAGIRGPKSTAEDA